MALDNYVQVAATDFRTRLRSVQTDTYTRALQSTFNGNKGTCTMVSLLTTITCHTRTVMRMFQEHMRRCGRQAWLKLQYSSVPASAHFRVSAHITALAARLKSAQVT